MDFPLNGLEHLAPMDWYFAGGLDTQTNLVPSNIDDRYHDIIADYNAFIAMSG